jgi:hypothetical protein
MNRAGVAEPAQARQWLAGASKKNRAFQSTRKRSRQIKSRAGAKSALGPTEITTGDLVDDAAAIQRRPIEALTASARISNEHFAEHRQPRQPKGLGQGGVHIIVVVVGRTVGEIARYSEVLLGNMMRPPKDNFAREMRFVKSLGGEMFKSAFQRLRVFFNTSTFQ